jgi:hypothetical protein
MLRRTCVLVYCVVACCCFHLAPNAAGNRRGKPKYAKSVSDDVIHAFSADTVNKDNWTSLSKLKAEYFSPDEGTDEGRLLSEIPWIQSDEGNKGFFAVQCHNFLEPHELVTSEEFKRPSACDLTKNRAYVIHIARWSVEGPPKAITYALKSSDWYVYESRGPKRLVQVKSATPDAPTLVGYKDAMLFGIHIFDFKENNREVFYSVGKDSEIRGQIRLKYTTLAQRTVPQNVQNLASVIAAISKATIGTSGTESVEAAPEPQNVLVLVAIAPGAKALPYKFTLGATLSTEKPVGVVNDPARPEKPEPDDGTKPVVSEPSKSPPPDSQNPWDWNLTGASVDSNVYVTRVRQSTKEPFPR